MKNNTQTSKFKKPVEDAVKAVDGLEQNRSADYWQNINNIEEAMKKINIAAGITKKSSDDIVRRAERDLAKIKNNNN